MGKSQRDKGARTERRFRDLLREMGLDPETTYRACQYSGKAPKGSSADIYCEELDDFYIEVKGVERLNIWGAYTTAKQDSGGKIPFVAHTKNQFPFLVTLSAEDFIRIVLTSEFLKRKDKRNED